MDDKQDSEYEEDTEIEIPEPWDLDRSEITLHFNRRPLSLQAGGKSRNIKGIRESAKAQTEVIFVGEVQIEITITSSGFSLMEATTIGDLDNLIKPIADAFNNVIWLDDKQVQAIDIRWIDSPFEPQFTVRVTGWGPVKRSELVIWKIGNHHFQGCKKSFAISDDDWIEELTNLYCWYRSCINLMEKWENKGVTDRDRRGLMPTSYIPFAPTDEWIVD